MGVINGRLEFSVFPKEIVNIDGIDYSVSSRYRVVENENDLEVIYNIIIKNLKNDEGKVFHGKNYIELLLNAYEEGLNDVLFKSMVNRILNPALIDYSNSIKN